MQSKGVVLELYEAPIYKREKAAFSTFVSLPEASFPALDGEEVDSPSKASSFWPSGWTSSTLLTGALFVSSGPPHSTTEQGWRCARGRPCSIPKCMFMSILTLSTNWGGVGEDAPRGGPGGIPNCLSCPPSSSHKQGWVEMHQGWTWEYPKLMSSPLSSRSLFDFPWCHLGCYRVAFWCAFHVPKSWIPWFVFSEISCLLALPLSI